MQRIRERFIERLRARPVSADLAAAVAVHARFASWARRVSCTRPVRIVPLVATLALAACRGGDGTEQTLRFPETSDPDAFGLFLNDAPATAAPGQPRGAIDNVEDFPQAYYATIDPLDTRTDFRAWRVANGFLSVDGQTAPCEPPDCERVRARFRDTKDLGYGRDMTMRRDHVTGDVAVYVENYQVDAITGLPYGPLNAEALAAGDRSWNFGVNAIEFSAYPYDGPDAPLFAKFYNFAGDGKRATGTSGSLQHAIDLDGRGPKNMPTPCIVCHGGLGRTLVIPDPADPGGTGRVLAPTLPGRPAGDVMANLQPLEQDTLTTPTSGTTRRGTVRRRTRARSPYDSPTPSVTRTVPTARRGSPLPAPRSRASPLPPSRPASTRRGRASTSRSPVATAPSSIATRSSGACHRRRPPPSSCPRRGTPTATAGTTSRVRPSSASPRPATTSSGSRRAAASGPRRRSRR